VPICICQVLEH